MLNALFWGVVATSSLILGGLLGSWFSFGKRTLGLIMAFGAGVLISAVSYELVYESVKLARYTGGPGLGFVIGALTFYFLDRWVGNLGGADRKAIGEASPRTFVIPLVLGIILDGIPESTVIGLGILETGKVSFAMLIAVFISNLPEAIAGTAGMRIAGRKRSHIMLLWFVIMVVCTAATVAGYAFFGNASNFTLAFIQAFAAGAILTMLANTMIPEAYEHGGKLAGLFTVLGFFVSVVVVILEHS
jgi:ZIP family zinc transporter